MNHTSPPNITELSNSTLIAPYTFDGCSNFECSFDRIQYHFKKNDEVWVYSGEEKAWLPGFVLASKLELQQDEQLGKSAITKYKIYMPIHRASALRVSLQTTTTHCGLPSPDLNMQRGEHMHVLWCAPESGLLKPDTTWMREILVAEGFYRDMWDVIGVVLDAWSVFKMNWVVRDVAEGLNN